MAISEPLFKPSDITPLPFYSKVRPQEIGIYIREIPWISLDHCGGDKAHTNSDQITPWYAHTHLCPYDPDYHMICMMRKNLRNSDGTLSEVFWHEYAHVFTDYSKYISATKCGPTANTHSIISYGGKDSGDANNWGHGIEWQKTMVSWGLNPTRIVNAPY